MTHPDTLSNSIQTAFQAGDYLQVIARIRAMSGSEGGTGLPHPPEIPSLQDRAYFGVSLMRTGALTEAAGILEQAWLQGSQEAGIEHANLLRAQGHTAAACTQLEGLLPDLDGELQLRALRWLGVCEEHLGRPGGLERVAQARLGYIRLGDVELGARLTQTLAAMYSLRGQPTQARQMLGAALPILEQQQNQRPYLSALCTLAHLQMETRLYDESEHTLEGGLAKAERIGDDYNRVRVLHLQAVLAQLRGDTGRFLTLCPAALQAAERVGDGAMIERTGALLADHHSRLGDHVRAAQVIARIYRHLPSAGLDTLSTEALVLRRRGDLLGAYRRLTELRHTAEAQSRPLTAARLQLQAAYTRFLMHDYAAAGEELAAGLDAVSRSGVPGGPIDVRADLEEIAPLLDYAQADPVNGPMLATLLHGHADLLGAQPDRTAGPQRLELLTLGQMSVLQGGALVSYEHKKSVLPVLTYIALHPNCSRKQMQLDLFPEKRGEAAVALIRRSVTEINDRFGPVIVQEGGYHTLSYRISPKTEVQTDVMIVLQRLLQNDVSGALSAYKGEFLPGSETSEWTDALRGRLDLSLRAALDWQIDRAEQQGQDLLAVQLCTQGLRRLQGDPELLERRVRCAERVCSPVVIAEYRSALHQALN